MRSHRHKAFLNIFTIFVFLYQTLQIPAEKVAVVTGSNKGIGYEIVKGLCEKYGGKVYLTARDENKGKAAVEKLKQLGLKPLFHQLDVTDQASIDKFKDYLNKTEGGIDILINNAGVAYLFESNAQFDEEVDVTIGVNYFGLLHASEALIPLLRQNGRVINLSSALGLLSRIPSPEIRAKFSNPSLTVEQLTELVNQYVKDAHAKGREEMEKTWGDAYVISKVAVAALTFIQQRNHDKEPNSKDILVNCVHPGYVNTDLTHHKGVLSPEEGAKAPLYLALENHGLHGKFVWNNSTVVDWNS